LNIADLNLPPLLFSASFGMTPLEFLWRQKPIESLGYHTVLFLWSCI